MLKYMTKAAFIEAVDQRKFVVKELSDTKYEVYLMGFDPIAQTFGIRRVTNPDSKDGIWRKSGGGYNKAQATIDDIAWYVDRNAEDKDSNPVSCTQYFQSKQCYERI